MLRHFLSKFIRWVCNIFRKPTGQTGSISGRVTDQAGAGVQGAQVTATNAAHQGFGPVVTDADGCYRISNLTRATYTVSVQAPAGFQNPARFDFRSGNRSRGCRD